MMKTFYTFTAGVVFTVLILRMFPTMTNAYHKGQDDLMIEAYENGVAEKIITEEGTYGYRWIETHKLGYE